MVSDVGFRSERGPVLISLMVASGVSAMDIMILATALPSVVDDLGGLTQFPWLFSIYVLTTAVTTPIYGKLADQFGRKPVMLAGLAIFLLGSILCGLAWSMPALIAFRAVQGIGAGAILPLSNTILGDIYSVAERARVQGYVASVWAMAAVFGPTIGGIFAQLGMWRVVFFINIPLCLLAGWLLVRHLKEDVERKRHRIDFLGAGLLAVSLSLIILALLEGGQAWAWNSWQSIGAFTAGGLLLVAFLFVESRAAEPILPLWVFSRRVVLTTTLTSLMLGSITIGLIPYIPSFLQGTLGTAPILAGLALSCMNLGWPLSSGFSGRFYLRLGFRTSTAIGFGVVVLGLVGLGLFARTPMLLVVAAFCFVCGLGFGLAATSPLVGLQSTVPWRERGVATGTFMFARSIGSALGVAVYGAIYNAQLRGVTADQLTPELVIDGTSAVLTAALVAAVIALIAALAIPRIPVVAPEAPATEPENAEG